MNPDDNPWMVDSVQDFMCLKCPECTFDTKTEEKFQNHAIGNHPLSIVFFGNIKVEVDVSIQENYDKENQYIDPLESKGDLQENRKNGIDPDIEIKKELKIGASIIN